jgi:hypothetical protein
MKLWCLALVALVGCKDKNANPTAAGAVVLDWKLADSDRTTIRNAKVEDVKSQDIDWVDQPTDDTQVKLKLHVETAKVTYDEDGKTMSLPAPVVVKATVVDAGDFTFSKPSCGGPHYPMGAPGEMPTNTLLQCRISTHKPRYEVGISFEIDGSGKVERMFKK